jgi:hypothetical protein
MLVSYLLPWGILAPLKAPNNAICPIATVLDLPMNKYYQIIHTEMPGY